MTADQVVNELGESAFYYLTAPGLCAWSVCVPNGMTHEEIAEEANRREPTGISSRWQVSDEPEFASGKPNPCPCEQEPESRLHYLLNC